MVSPLAADEMIRPLHSSVWAARLCTARLKLKTRSACSFKEQETDGFALQARKNSVRTLFVSEEISEGKSGPIIGGHIGPPRGVGDVIHKKREPLRLFV